MYPLVSAVVALAAALEAFQARAPALRATRSQLSAPVVAMAGGGERGATTPTGEPLAGAAGEQGDGLFSTRWIVSSAAAATLLVRRDTATMMCIVGAILNALLSKVMKRVINEARPEGARLTDPGMPSSHAQSLFFFAAYLSAAAARADVLPALALETGWPVFSRGPAKPEVAAAFFLAAFGAAVVAAGLRVSSGLHTREQVGAGAFFGSLTGFGWCLIVQPQLESAVGALGAMGQAAIAAVLVAGALVVGSVERKIGAALKKRR